MSSVMVFNNTICLFLYSKHCFQQISHWISGLANSQWVKRWLRRKGFSSWSVFLCIPQKYFSASYRIIYIPGLKLYIIAVAFKNLALFETWQFVPYSSKKAGDNSLKPKMVIFLAWVIQYRVRFIIVENLQHVYLMYRKSKPIKHLLVLKT